MNDQDQSYQDLVKRMLLSNLLRKLSQILSFHVGSIPQKDLLQFINYFHFLGGTSDEPPSLGNMYTNGSTTEIFDQIAALGSTISSSNDNYTTGLKILRDFVSEKFPLISKILANVKSDIYTDRGLCVISKDDGSLCEEGKSIFAVLFQGDPDNNPDNGQYSYPELVNVSQILPKDIFPNDEKCNDSVSDDEKQLSTVLRAINDFYFNIFPK